MGWKVIIAPSARADLETIVRFIASQSSDAAINPDICNGKPVVKGTRIAVQTVLEFLAAGNSAEDVLEEYPALAREDVQDLPGVRFQIDGEPLFSGVPDMKGFLFGNPIVVLLS